MFFGAMPVWGFNFRFRFLVFRVQGLGFCGVKNNLPDLDWPDSHLNSHEFRF